VKQSRGAIKSAYCAYKSVLSSVRKARQRTDGSTDLTLGSYSYTCSGKLRLRCASDPTDCRRAQESQYEIHRIIVRTGGHHTAGSHGTRGSQYQMGQSAGRPGTRIPVGGTIRSRHAFGGPRLHPGIRMVRRHRTQRCAWLDLCRQYRLPLSECGGACTHVRRGDWVSDHYVHDRRLLGPVLQK
jgi:hypothetical protein